MPSLRPILVTGAPRSGTTWVGRVIAAARSVRYIHEPFQVMQPRCSCGIHFDDWFYYVTAEESGPIQTHFQHLLGHPLNRFDVRNLVTLTRDAPNPRDALRRLYRYARSLLSVRPLIKDPIACMSAEWLASTFDMEVIVLVRHPAAFVSSYKRLAWSHPFSHFLKQSALINEQLYPFAAEIARYSEQQQDLVDQAALLWRLINFVLLKYSQRHGWIMVRHSDIAREPHSAFKAMFEKIDLPFSSQVQRRISALHDYVNAGEAEPSYRNTTGDHPSIWQWKQLLTPEEIRRVRVQVDELASLFFSDEDW